MTARAAIAAVVLVLLSACSGAAPASAPPPSPVPAPEVYVAVGASESVGYGLRDPVNDAWTQRLYRMLPPASVFVNAAVAGATVADALERQVPLALEAEPTLVTVWLNVNDLRTGLSPGRYGGELTQLLGALRRNGRTEVLVANTPPLDRLPAYLACLAAGRLDPGVARACFGGPVLEPAEVVERVADYNAEIDRAAQETGATVVDLHAATMAARAAGAEASLVGPDGFHPSEAGHELVARLFAEALGLAGQKAA